LKLVKLLPLLKIVTHTAHLRVDISNRHWRIMVNFCSIICYASIASCYARRHLLCLKLCQNSAVPIGTVRIGKSVYLTKYWGVHKSGGDLYRFI